MRTALSFGAEWGRQVGRTRTRWIAGIVLALPLVFVGAFALDRGPREGRGGAAAGTRMVDLATSGGANFAVFALFVASELLLVVVAALLLGDPVPAEASWSSLRYLLTAPVRRARLLTAKVSVGLVHLAIILVVLPVWAYVIGTLAYGSAPFTIPGGGSLDAGTLAGRLALGVAYLFVAMLPVAAIAFWIGVGTDTPLAAVGGALIVYIVAGILDSIDALGSLRNGLPGHYQRSWLDLLQPTIDWTNLRHGLLWSLLWALVFLALGWRRFARKDVLS
jgi:ABC-2 type transport system permease protein